MPMRLIQITDLHIPLPEQESHGVDVRKNFQSVLEKVHQFGADGLVLSGDLSFDIGRKEIYEWIKRELQVFDTPLFFLSGNHDNPRMLAEVMEIEHLLEEEELYYRVELGGKSFLMLDTSPARMSDQQFAWLDRQLEGAVGPVWVFMHHPPLAAGVPFMDERHPFHQQSRFQKLIEQHQVQAHIFTGHYHVDKVVQQAGMTVYITPSTYFQINQEQEDFAVDHYRIGFRVLDWEGPVFRTYVHYLDGHSASTL
jgi:Icc protein